MKKLLFFAAFIFISAGVVGQDEEEPAGALKDKLFAGGSLGLSFGSYTLINLSPQVGHRAFALSLSALHPALSCCCNGILAIRRSHLKQEINLTGEGSSFVIPAAPLSFR